MMNLSKRIPRISTAELLIFIGSYVVFALFYYTTLWLNRGGNDRYFDLQGFLNWGGIDYLLKLMLSLPVCWLMFVRLRQASLSIRLLLHCLTLPLFVYVWQKLYYLIIENLKLFHLSGSARVWDIYIPALFYILQFGILHAYVYFRQHQEKLALEAVLREAALKSELSALKAQLNPHFLYNVFNTINASIPAHLEQTRQMIAELSDLFRYQLQASRSELVSLRDELDFTRKYLQLEQARFEDRLLIEIEVAENLLEEMVPPMLIQPLVENAVKHGIAPLIEGGKVSIKAERRAKQLFFVIADTGKGIAEKEGAIGRGTGLTNTALRLEKMFGSSLELTDTLPHGLTVSFSIG